MASTPPIFAPPPWNLTGHGFALLYRFPQDWAQQSGHLAPDQREVLTGRWGAVMLVDYATSGVGPYQELLCIPGQVEQGGKHRFTISKIYVNTEVSVVNGRRNWGIAKEQADFAWIKNKDEQKITVTVNGEVALRARLNPFGIPFPLTTALLPLKLHQQLNGQRFETQPTANGWGRLARLTEMYTNPGLFPDLNRVKPLIGLCIDRFNMTFPRPETREVER
ncbi:MAG: acetoacetate decarboxylase family protein [Cytophagaceae bacterium]|nr:acetoacetate decarboxylase family protein [Cytophagaceae bacterium]